MLLAPKDLPSAKIIVQKCSHQLSAERLDQLQLAGAAMGNRSIRIQTPNSERPVPRGSGLLFKLRDEILLGLGQFQQRAVLVVHLSGFSFPVIHHCTAHAAAANAFAVVAF